MSDNFNSGMIARLIRKHRRVKINFILLSPPLYTHTLSLSLSLCSSVAYHSSSLSLQLETSTLHASIQAIAMHLQAFYLTLVRIGFRNRVYGRARKKETEERRSTLNYDRVCTGPEREKKNGLSLSATRILSLRRDINTLHGINDSCRVIPMWRYLARSVVSRDRTSQSKIKKFKRPIY